MRKLSVITLILILFSALSIFVTLTACGSDEPVYEAPGVGDSGLTYNVDALYKFSVTSDEDCPDGNIDDGKLRENLEVDKDGGKYYLVLDLTFENFNWADDNFTVTAYISPNDGLSATIEDAPTGTISERTEGYARALGTTYTPPRDRQESKSYRVIYKITMSGGAMFSAYFKVDDGNLSEPYTVGGLFEFSLNEDNSSYTVVGVLDEYVSAADIPEVHGGYPVTAIGEGAFTNCTNLKSIIIPKSITYIGANAFGSQNFGMGGNSGCNSLEGVKISDISKWCTIKFNGLLSNPLYFAHNLYLGGELLTHLDIDGVSYISDEAFYNCTSLESVNIGNGVTAIGLYAFENCGNLKDITLPATITSIANGAFYGTAYYNTPGNWQNNVLYIDNYLISAKSALSGDYSVEDGTVLIAGEAFYNCKNLESITLTDSVISIGVSSFNGCSGLRRVTAGSGLVSIGMDAFWKCSALESVDFGENSKLKEIGVEAFAQCVSLASLIIPASVTTIGNDAFDWCRGLVSITVDPQNANFSSADGILYDKNKTSILHVPTALTGEVVIPEGVTSIGYEQFYGRSVTSVVIPDSVTSIGHYAFRSCSNLEKVTIGTGLKSIGFIAFADCKLLTEIRYGGTIDSWNKIGKATSSPTGEGAGYWDSGTGEYTIYCLDGKIPKSSSPEYY